MRVRFCDICKKEIPSSENWFKTKIHAVPAPIKGPKEYAEDWCAKCHNTVSNLIAGLRKDKYERD